jgi:hypothetical protein
MAIDRTALRKLPQNEDIGSDPARDAAVLHRRLSYFNRRRLSPATGLDDWERGLQEEVALRRLERRFVEAERRQIADRLRDLPADADAFMQWFEALKESGPGQGDRLFPWLAREAAPEQMRWFLQQELAGEAGFDDLVAMTQLRLPVRAKLELARNYWDEMGRGRESAMHGPLLDRTAQAFGIRADIEATVWESLALANLMVALAANRHYAYQSIGALGVIEMTAPGRVSQVNSGLERLGHTADTRRYFQLHAGLDVRHSEAWNREVIRPLVAASPDVARPIAEGALLRLQAGARCFQRYRTVLGVPSLGLVTRSGTTGF